MQDFDKTVKKLTKSDEKPKQKSRKVKKRKVKKKKRGQSNRFHKCWQFRLFL